MRSSVMGFHQSRICKGRVVLHRLPICLPLLCLFPVNIAWAVPVIYNQPFSAKAGDIVNLLGSGFGTSPKIIFKPAHRPAAIPVRIIRADENLIAFEVPKSQPLDIYAISVSDGKTTSAPVSINTPCATHFDTPEIGSKNRFRIFGHNLHVPAAVPTVAFIDPKTNASLSAIVDVAASDAYSLAVVAPENIVPGASYRLVVSNGLASSPAEKTLLGRAPAGEDHFKLGVPWGADFIYRDGPAYQAGATKSSQADHHLFDVTSDPALKRHALGDGIADDRPAIQAAIDLAAAHGGVVYLPAGRYRLASLTNTNGLTLKSNVVLQGHSASDTTILYGPSEPQATGYSFKGIEWPANTKNSGIADLLLQNIDNTSQKVSNAVAKSPSQNLFIARVNWDLGSGIFILMQGVDKLVVTDSTFRQSANSQFPNIDFRGNSGVGPVYLWNIGNAIFRNNKISWASGQNSFKDVDGAVIEGNHFTRSASDQIVAGPENLSWAQGDQKIAVGDVIQRSEGRQLSLNFAKNVAVQNNVFDVSDGVLKHNWYDGETLLSEGGGASHKHDVGTATAAGDLTITDDSKCAGACTWGYSANSMIAIVSGKGWGQWRQIVAQSGNSFSIDRPWDVVPEAGDHFSIFEPSYENVLIRNNLMRDNPAGILLYHAAFLNVSIVNNTLMDNGGIFLRGDQRKGSIGAMRNIEIIGNTLKNTKGQFPSYIVAEFALIAPNAIWGTNIDSIVVRSNALTARPGTPAYLFPEGYMSVVQYQAGGAGFSPDSAAPAIAGMVFQGNSCNKCPVAYTLSTGNSGTIIWGAIAGDAASAPHQFLLDKKIANTARDASVGTVVGGD